LGIFEASFDAGAPYYLSLFYQRRELAFRAFGAPWHAAACQLLRRRFSVQHHPHQAFDRSMEVTFHHRRCTYRPVYTSRVFLPSRFCRPGQAKLLSEGEQTEAVERMQTKDRTPKNKGPRASAVRRILDYRNVVHTLIHFMCSHSFAGLSSFLPTILKGMGYSSVNAQGLTAPVYFASFLLCVAATLASDGWDRRGFIVAGFATVSCIGYLSLATIEDKTKVDVRYFGVWLAMHGIFPALSINITWLLNNNGGESKRDAGLAILAIFGQGSSFCSSAVFPNADA
jgi:hypothetical protein